MNHDLKANPEGFAAALLFQGKGLDAWSRLFALVTGLLLAAALGSDADVVAIWALATGLALGLVQAFFALRSQFDAEVFARVAASPDSWRVFDRTLGELGLAPRSVPLARDVASRSRGAMRLLVLQFLALLAQLVCLLAAVGFACR